MREHFNSTKTVRGISPQLGAGDNTAQVSAIIDRQNHESLLWEILTGTIADADATFAVTMDHGDIANLSDAVAVPAADLLGSYADAGFTFASDDSVRKIGYKGSKRYVRLTITPSANTGTWGIAASALLGHSRHNPSQAGTGVAVTQVP